MERGENNLYAFIDTLEKKVIALELLRELKKKMPPAKELIKEELDTTDYFDEEILKIVDLEVS